MMNDINGIFSLISFSNKENILMIDFHGTLKESARDGLISKMLTFFLFRKLLGIMSGFRWFVNFANQRLVPNIGLIQKLNYFSDSPENLVVVVSAACESTRDIMEKELEDMGLDYDYLILRERFLQSHTKYKVGVAKKIHRFCKTLTVVEDCFHYGKAIKKAIPKAIVRCPNWNTIIA